MKTISEMRRELAEKAAGDESFRKSLMADPKAVIARELNVQIPEGVEIAVHEDSSTTAHLVLSPNPQLSDVDLEGVSGGKSYHDHLTDPDGRERANYPI